MLPQDLLPCDASSLPDLLHSPTSTASPDEFFCNSTTIYNADASLDNIGFVSLDSTCMQDIDRNALVPCLPASTKHELPDSVADDCTIAETPNQPDGSADNTLDGFDPRGHSAIYPSSRGGWMSALHMAARKGHFRIARMLLERNMDCDERDSDGLTPLIHAVVGGHEELGKLLLSYGARVGSVDRHRRSALHWAIIHRRETLLNALAKHCAIDPTSIDGYDSDGMTPLHIAIDTNWEVGVGILLQCGANVHYRASKCAVKTME